MITNKLKKYLQLCKTKTKKTKQNIHIGGLKKDRNKIC